MSGASGRVVVLVVAIAVVDDVDVAERKGGRRQISESVIQRVGSTGATGHVGEVNTAWGNE